MNAFTDSSALFMSWLSREMEDLLNRPQCSSLFASLFQHIIDHFFISFSEPCNSNSSEDAFIQALKPLKLVYTDSTETLTHFFTSILSRKQLSPTHLSCFFGYLGIV